VLGADNDDAPPAEDLPDLIAQLDDSIDEVLAIRDTPAEKRDRSAR